MSKVCGTTLTLGAVGLLAAAGVLRGRGSASSQGDSKLQFVLFTKRTEEPKLGWLESRLTEAGISHRRNGESFHAPILEVESARLDDAWAILDPVDDIPDDDPMFDGPWE